MESFAGRWPGTTRAGSMRRNPAAPWRHVDLLLLGSVVCIALIGTLMVFSSTRGAEPGVADTSILERHLTFLAAGGTVMALVTMADYRRFRDWAPIFYIGVCALLLGVVSPLGSEVNGAQAWFQLGPIQLQPSEFAKIAVILGLASLGAHFGNDIDVRRLAVLLTVPGIPLVLIMLQPDPGTAIVMVALTMGILVVAGVRAKHIAALSLVGLTAVVGLLSSGFLEDYQKDRLTVFLNPSAGLQAEAYNLNQSKIAIGSGGVLGKGLFNGTQTQLDIVPEQHTDFIFTAVGEELGFVGAATLLVLFAIVVWRVWRIAQLSRDQLGVLLCVGVLSMLVFQIFQNAGMTMGIMPITGIPLPFVSYGGSSTIALFAGVGLVQSVHMRRFT
ncbi:MAG TPA: rod shape-determining protein RodA [Acidimicrobiales bacterium]|nr:rod shape-determining protein RodA [Acidimicrobiales bacterium]